MGFMPEFSAALLTTNLTFRTVLRRALLPVNARAPLELFTEGAVCLTNNR